VACSATSRSANARAEVAATGGASKDFEPNAVAVLDFRDREPCRFSNEAQLLEVALRKSSSSSQMSGDRVGRFTSLVARAEPEDRQG
jgi:hypothetical protein